MLKTLIDLHLPRTIHTSTVNYDLQRKAIKLLAQLLPVMINHPDHKARLLASLIRQLSSNRISSEQKTDAGLSGLGGRPNSDFAAKLIDQPQPGRAEHALSITTSWVG